MIHIADTKVFFILSILHNFFLKEGEKRKKRGKKGEKAIIEREKKSLSGRMMTNLIFQWGTKKYFPPICTVPSWGEKYHLEMGGGGKKMIFGRNINP